MENKNTIEELLKWSLDRLKQSQVDDPHFEAEFLLSNALNTERIKLYTRPEKEVGKDKYIKFKDYIERRAKREPTAYITGYQPFLSYNMKVTKDTLIPRPETELLVNNVLDISNNFNDQINLLDIGTGSGAIAVALAKQIDNVEIIATDLSEKALKIAEENAKTYKVADKIKFQNADLFPKEKMKFDIIVSNPPYIPTDVIKRLQPEIKDYEPIQALDGGKDGLDYYRKIISKITDYLKPYGFMLFEIGLGQSNEIIKLINNVIKANDIRIKKDLSGVERIVLAKIVPSS